MQPVIDYSRISRASIIWAGALPWTLVGSGLFLLGTDLVAKSELAHSHALAMALLVASALAVGYLKSRVVLSRVAQRTLDRLANSTHGSVFQQVLSALGLRSLALVLVMVALGMVIRRSGVAPEIRGWVCLAIGFALLWSARAYWRWVIGQRWTHRLAMVALALWLLMGGLMWWALPPASLLPPTGPYAVGVRDWVVVDTARAETFSETPSDRRRLSLRAWYPAEQPAAGQAAYASYLPHARKVYEGIGKSLGLPPFLLGAAAAVRTNSWQDAVPILAEKWPLVLYSGGYRQGHQAHNSELAEELASYGYVVVGVNHPYEQALTELGNGEILTLADERLYGITRRLMEADAGVPAPTAEQLLALSGQARARKIREHMARLPVHAASAERWRLDMQTVFDWIEQGHDEMGSFIAPLVNHDAIGMLGMSFGGSTAGQFCALQARCRAAVNLDGTQWGEWFGDHFDRPVLYLSQDLETWNDAWYAGADQSYYRYKLRGAEHGDFTDGFQSTPMTRSFGLLGPIGGRRSAQIMRVLVLTFFDQYLKGAPEQLRAVARDYPELVEPLSSEP